MRPAHRRTCHSCGSAYTGPQCPRCYTQHGQLMQNTADTLTLARRPPTPFEAAMAWVTTQFPTYGHGTVREDGTHEATFDTIAFDEEPGVLYLVLAFRREGQDLVATICKAGGQPEDEYANGWRETAPAAAHR